ncbi:MAG: hypothetical protein SGI73_19260 [Chloroflexota bacterium]|nr:hypothetical protein [Chloroflexota bacterium]
MAKRNPDRRKGKRQDEDEEAKSLFLTNEDNDRSDVYDPDANDERYKDLEDDDRDDVPPAKSGKRRRDDDEALEIDDEVFNPPRARAPVGVIGGTISVVLTAIIALILFTLLGFGIVFGGRLAGIITPSIPQASSSGFVRPTVVAVVPDVALPTADANVDPRCDLAGEWWNAVSPQYNVIAAQFGSLYATAPEQRETSRGAVQIARDAIANTQTPPCLARAQQSLLSAAQEALNVTTQIAAGDTSTYAGGRGTLEIAFADMYAAIWGDADFSTDLDTPIALSVPRLGSDVNCTPETQTWYTSIRPSLQAFDVLLNTDPAPLLGPRLRTLIDDMGTTVATIRQSTPPACATTARDLLATALEGYARGNELIGQGDAASAQAAFAEAVRDEFKFNAWMNWLGAPPI